MKTTGLIYHNDLDGLISAMLIVKSGSVNISKAFPIEYGKDHSELKQQCDEFIILDYADNVTEEKTTLWIDHHLKSKDVTLPEYAIIKESPSCARIVHSVVTDPDITREDLDIIDIIDSAGYVFDENFSKEDVLFPDTKTRVGQWIALNQILMKNRKTNVCNHLLEDMVIDPASMLLKIEQLGGKTKTFSKYIQDKKALTEKIIDNPDDYCMVLDGVPVVMTKKFSMKDWAGYDRNIFYYIYKDYPFCITTFDMSTGFNFQVSRNLFYTKELKSTVLELIESAAGEEPRGHENIINFSFEDKEAGLQKIDEIVNLIASGIGIDF